MTDRQTIRLELVKALITAGQLPVEPGRIEAFLERVTEDILGPEGEEATPRPRATRRRRNAAGELVFVNEEPASVTGVPEVTITAEEAGRAYYPTADGLSNSSAPSPIPEAPLPVDPNAEPAPDSPEWIDWAMRQDNMATESAVPFVPVLPETIREGGSPF